jgi:elongation factor Ts
MVAMDVIKSLREETGAGILDVKKALEEANGEVEKARELLRARGIAKAAKKADRETKEGYVGSYVHMTGKLAAMVTLLCETDFVARNDEFKKLANEIAMHIACMQPENIAELMAQPYVRDDASTISDLVKGLSGKVGENIAIGEMQIIRI